MALPTGSSPSTKLRSRATFMMLWTSPTLLHWAISERCLSKRAFQRLRAVSNPASVRRLRLSLNDGSGSAWISAACLKVCRCSRETGSRQAQSASANPDFPAFYPPLLHERTATDDRPIASSVGPGEGVKCVHPQKKLVDEPHRPS